MEKQHGDHAIYFGILMTGDKLYELRKLYIHIAITNIPTSEV
jgi:hypothetical protein